MDALLLVQTGDNVVLADEMGLGKTIQTIAFLGALWKVSGHRTSAAVAFFTRGAGGLTHAVPWKHWSWPLRQCDIMRLLANGCDTPTALAAARLRQAHCCCCRGGLCCCPRTVCASPTLWWCP